jgi:hypothetical protein
LIIRFYVSDDLIKNLPAEKAKRILFEIWKNNIKARCYITAAMENID